MTVKLIHHTPLVICSDSIRKCWDSGDKSDKHYVNSCCGVDWDEIEKNYYECPSCGLPCTSETIELVCGPKDKELIDRVGNKYKHESVKRHLNYHFDVKGISTKTLLALSRYTVGISLSVTSTRFTCKKSLKNEKNFVIYNSHNATKNSIVFDEVEPISFDEYVKKNNINIESDATLAGYHKFYLPSQKAINRAAKYITFTGDDDVNDVLIRQLELSRQLVKKGKSCDEISMTLSQAYKYNLSMTMNLQSLQHFISQRLNKSAHWDIQDLAINIVKAFPDDHFYLIEDIVKKEVDSNQRVKNELERYVSKSKI